MPTQVTVQPDVLVWARKRAGFDYEGLAQAIKIRKPEKIIQWEQSGEISMSQLEKLAQKTFTPIGYLFLAEPPEDRLPITDFRTGSVRRGYEAPSPNLLDTIYLCQFRQDWLSDHLRKKGEDLLDYVGSVDHKTEPASIAQKIRDQINYDIDTQMGQGSWGDVVRTFVKKIEDIGINVMRSGVVGNNNYRKLDISEFRGFSLSDKYAPLIFVNSTDSPSAQMFTLAHELTHIWLGQSGVSSVDVVSGQEIERFCNKVAAELLVPAELFKKVWTVNGNPNEVAKRFRVSTFVILIRAYESGLLGKDDFISLIDKERRGEFRGVKKSSGGNFYNTQGTRLGKRFVRNVVSSTLTGITTYTEAFQLLGIKKSKVFNQFAETYLATT